MRERVTQQGLSDPRLEVGKKRNWRDSVTPTKDSDIGPKARTFMLLVDQAVLPTMALEGMQGGRGTQEMVDAQTSQLRAIKGNAVRAGIGMRAFELRVKLKVEEIKERAKQEAEDAELADKVRTELTTRRGAISGDWPIIHAEFPGQFDTDDADAQARQGEVPVNWGNHAKKADAGGFEPVRRGW